MAGLQTWRELQSPPARLAAAAAALGAAAGLGFVAGLGSGVSVATRWADNDVQAGILRRAGANCGLFWRMLLSALAQRLEGRTWTGDRKAQLLDPSHGVRAPPATHYVLRPGADPRVDQAKYVRYDPPADRKTGAIVIVVPGGNYDECDVYCGEGQPVAHWLAQQGITGVVLQYRCVSQGHYWPAQFYDWQECAQAVIEQAPSWGCDPARVGILGFSAGGHLAAYCALVGQGAYRPQLQVLVYPSTDTLTPRESDAMDPWNPEEGYPPPETSSHLLVGPDTPPAFLAGMTSDELCPASENTDVYAEALRQHCVPHKYVVDHEDGHGCGLKDWWTLPCNQWLVEQGWARPLPNK